MKLDAKCLIGAGILAIFVLGLDQLTKFWALETFLKDPTPLTVLPIFDLVLVFNKGVSFGFFSQDAQMGVYFLVGMTSLLTLGLVIWLFNTRSLPLALGIGAMLGGAVGNIIDRLQYGAVVDFLYFHWDHHGFPAFNIADTGITIGVLFVLLDSYLDTRRHKQ